MISMDVVLAVVFFILPGFFALRTFEWFVADSSLSIPETVAWSIGLSLLAATPLVAVPWTSDFMGYLWSPSQLTADFLVGVGMHLGSGILLGCGSAWLVLRVGRGVLGRWSFYRRSWDWMWASFGTESRTVVVEASEARYLGFLAFADDPAVGRDLVLRDPAVWLESEQAYYRTGMKFMFIRGSGVSRIELSVANPLADSDRPYFGSGYVDPMAGEQREADDDI